MKRLATITGFLLFTSTIAANAWQSDKVDGVLTAAISLGDLDYIEALCDVGIDIPITSISFMIHGNMPEPGSRVEFRFGPQSRIYAIIDEEGVIASSNEDDGAVFDRLIEAMKTKSEMVVRLPSGIRQTFPLEGSEAALEGCQADANKLAPAETS